MEQLVETGLGPVTVVREGQGQPVLFIHGSPGGWDSSVVMGRFLVEAGFEVIAPSRPGYPGTPLLERTGIDQQADLHAALLDALGIPSAGVLTWSGGGPSGYRLAVLHPERVTALAAFASVSGSWEPPPAGLDERLIEDTDFGNWVLRFMTRHAPKSTMSSTLAAEGDLDRKEVKALVAEAMEDDNQRDVILTMAAVVADHRNRREGLDNDSARFAAIESLELERIEAPALVVHGNADADVPYEHGRFAASTIPGARLETMDRGTHLSLFVHPECGRFQKVVADHLSTAAS